MSDIPEHPISKRVRDSKERAQATVSRILAGETPPAEDLRHLAVQYVATDTVGRATSLRSKTGLYFEYPGIVNPPPMDGELFLVACTSSIILPADWHEPDRQWRLRSGLRQDPEQICAVLRVPTVLTPGQLVTIDAEREILAEDENRDVDV